MKIALIGYGIENASAYRYLLVEHPDAAFTVYDQADAPREDLPEGVGFFGGLEEFADLDADLIVRSPGIAPRKIRTTAPVTSATKIFFDECRVPIIGVTGSKGKGTTCSLIAGILRTGGRTAWLVGNIGAPALDILADIKDGDIVVYEMSSFQLWDLTKSPQTAVVLMIEPEHLDVHDGLADYVEAKGNIARFQTGSNLVIYNAENDFSRHIADESQAEHVGYPSHEAAHVRSGNFCYGDTVLCPVGTLKLPGGHNIGNALAAIDAAWQFVRDPAAIASGLSGFTGLPHRLKFVREVGGVSFYDDSIATTPGSAIAALLAFDGPKVIILGGSYKGADFDGLARTIVSRNIRRALLIGSESPRIADSLRKAGFSDFTDYGSDVTMDDVVRESTAAAHPGDIVILSPACASFGMFKNYADRGDRFIDAVDALEEAA